jgi:hypothetical protein
MTVKYLHFSGLLSFIGCMIIAKKFSGSSFGLSFKFSLSAGLFVLSISEILILYLCYKRRHKVKRQASNDGQIQTYARGGAAPYDTGPPSGLQIKSARTEETHVVHKSNGFVLFMNNINIFHLITHDN